MLTVGSLFSGIGGFDLGLERAGMSVRWQVENNDYCRNVLNKHWPKVPCHYDVRAIDWREIPRVDLVCGGFPCQPFSLAGKRKQENDARNLWPEMRRAIDGLRPTWVLGENVAGATRYIHAVVKPDLEAFGYRVRVFGIPACAVGASHLRQRRWIVAYADGQRQSQPQGSQRKQRGRIEHGGEDVADANSQGLQGRGPKRGLEEGGKKIKAGRGGDVAYTDSQPTRRATKSRQEYRDRKFESALGVLAHGLPAGLVRWGDEPEGVPRVAQRAEDRVHKLRGLGNAIVPQIAEALGKMILAVMQALEEKEAR